MKPIGNIFGFDCVTCEHNRHCYGGNMGNQFRYCQKSAEKIQNLDKLQQENKQLKMIVNEYEKLNKGFKITNVQEYNIDELLSYKKYKNNWNKLKEYIEKDYGFYDKLIAPEYGCAMGSLSRIKDKMQELEQGSDSNE